MNKIKRIFFVILPVLFLSGCFFGKNKELDKVDNAKNEVIEVEKRPITSNVNIKSASFASDIILDKLAKEEDKSYIVTKINNYSQIESLDFDVAVIPAYQVVDLFNKTNGNIKLAAITMLNNIHIISDKQINNPTEMAGKTIMVPELNESMNKLIDSKLGFAKRLMKIRTEFYHSQKDIVKNLENSENIIAFLSEPYYSKAISKKQYYSFDVNETISMLPNSENESEGDFVSEVIIVNKNYLRDNRDSFDKFLADYKKAQSEIKEGDVLSQGIINNYDITNEEAIKIFKSMDKTFLDSDTMAGVFEIFLDKLEGLDKNIFSGDRPSDDLYYKSK